MIEREKVTIKNLPAFSEILGCLGEEDDYTHLGAIFTNLTACGKPLGNLILSGDIHISCPVCIAEIKYRNEHPEVRRQELGIVTHLEKL